MSSEPTTPPPADQATDARIDAHVNAHYAGAPDLGARILAALRAAGRDPDRPTWEDLAPVDQFHTRGAEATLALARLAGLTPNDLVLDAGGGVGGPARARAAPLDDASVDVAWTQHSTMNIPDKPRLYAELRRVLRPGGRYAMHEIFAEDDGAPLHFPVPWAPEPSISFLRPAGWTRAAVTAAGFRARAWEDVTAATLAWVRERAAAGEAARAAGRPPALGLHLLLGAGFAEAFGNLARNLAEGRVRVAEAVFEAA